ncbi:hypothetical protein TruAng_010980 [Truncatella angustata]|nr:hypothetical protein TruAng_010980 [Truncatella angustata]
MTFDDGPWNYTSDLLDKLKDYGAKATFFITGNNIGKGPINDPDLPWKAVIQRMAAEGHQVASHTWSHQNFSELTTTQAQNQMIWNEIALNDILGYIPTYMRPPFSICEDECESMLYDLGYHVIYFDLDTEGYLNDDPTLIQASKDIWDENVDNSDACDANFLQIEHDIHWQTVYNLTDYFLESLFSYGFRSVTVGECLGDPPANWYRAGSSSVPAYTFPVKSPTVSLDCGEAAMAKRTTVGQAADSSTGASPTPTGGAVVSEDGDCGNGITCVGSEFGNCCSQYGYCGNTTDYCDQGCQPAWGSGCLSSSSSAPSTSAPTSTSKSTSVTTTSPSTTSTTTKSPSTTSTTTTKTTSATSSSTTVTVPSTTSTRTTSTTKTSTSSSTSTSRSTSRSTSTSTSRSTTRTSTTTATSPTPTILVPSEDGTCGPGTGYTCRSSKFGLCCTLDGQCALLCLLTGCQPDYGTCAVLVGPGGGEEAGET